jgi:putative transposase
MVSPQGRREQIQLACQRALSQRQACGQLGVARSTLTYELRLPAKDAPVIALIKALSAQYQLYGYRLMDIEAYDEASLVRKAFWDRAQGDPE